MIYLRRLTDRLVKFWFPLLVLFVLTVSVAYSEPVAYLSDGDTRITLTNEPCKLDVKLQFRMTWKDKNKTYEGCFGVLQGIVVAFFDDKSLALFPAHAFKPLTGS